MQERDRVGNFYGPILNQNGGLKGGKGMRLEDKYRSMTEEEREEERRKLEAYEEREERRAGQYGGGMWDE